MRRESEFDPPVQFRMSHAMKIEATATRVSMLMWMMGGILALSVAMIGWMAMHT